MRIPDSQLEEWYRLVLEREVPAGEPMEAKLALARAIAARSHGEEAAAAAAEHFTRVVREGQAPDELPTRRCRRATPSICRHCSPPRSASRRARRAG